MITVQNAQSQPEQTGYGLRKRIIDHPRLKTWCCLALSAFIVLSTAGQAQSGEADREGTIETATAAITAALGENQNPYELLCSDTNAWPNKNLMTCDMNPPNNGFEIWGCKTPDPTTCTGDTDSLASHLKDLQTVAEGGVDTVELSTALIPKMPCLIPTDLTCSAYVKQFPAYSGLALFLVGNTVENAGINTSTCASDEPQVQSLLQTQYDQNNPGTVMSSIRLLLTSEDMAKAFTKSLDTLSTYGKANGELVEITGYVKDDGSFLLDNFSSISTKADDEACFANWTCATAAVVADAYSLDKPACLPTSD